MTTTRTRLGFNDSYSLSGVKRIRTPHPHDVLSGRGGGINSHVGNKTFREWVRERKEAYNLAASKAEKARVANEVIDLVRAQNPPGRFLQRDPSSVSGPSWWVEVDEARALAKTSQALREGAPQIRAAHKDELEERAERAKIAKRKKPSTSSTNFGTQHANQVSKPTRRTSRSRAPQHSHSTRRTHARSISTEEALESLQQSVQEAKSLAEQQQAPSSLVSVPPLMSNRQFQERFCGGGSPPNKKPRTEETKAEEQINPLAETPPLMSAPPPALELTPLKLGSQSYKLVSPGQNISHSGGNGVHTGLIRSHSLAWSDISTGDFPGTDEEFVNPFADESDLLHHAEAPKIQPPKALRNLSSDENNHEGTSNVISTNTNNNILGIRNNNVRSSMGSSMSSRYVKHYHTRPTPLTKIRNNNSKNCFCDCAEDGKACICGDLADHLLHRGDGLSLFLTETL